MNHLSEPVSRRSAGTLARTPRPRRVLATIFLGVCLVNVAACSSDPEPVVDSDQGASDSGTLDTSDDVYVPSGPLPPVASLVDIGNVLNPTAITYYVDDARSGLVPGDFEEPVWQIGITFSSQSFLGQEWSHSATLVIPDTLPSDVHQAAVIQRSTQNPVEGISDSVSFVPQFAAITADRLDIPVLMIDNIPPSIDLRSVSEFDPFTGDHPECFTGPINDESLLTDCLWQLAQKAERPDLFPVLPAAIAYIRSVSLLVRLAQDVPTFDLGFEVPAFAVDEAAILADGLGGISLRYAMAMDSRIVGVMAAGADIGAFDLFYDLQQEVWTSDYSFGDPAEQGDYWEAFEARDFLSVYSLATLRDSFADRSYLAAVGTSDPRTPLAALDLYRRDLPADNAVLYVSGYEGGMGTLEHLLAWRVFLAHVFSGRQWAQLTASGEYSGGDLDVRVAVETSTTLSSVELWYVHRHADSDDLDFRDALWRRVPMTEKEGGYVATVTPLADNVAYFVQVMDAEDIFEGPLSSNVGTVSR